MILAVRHHHERTHPLFAQVNAESLDADKVLKFTGQPFFNTFREMLETLVEQDDDYFLTVDADMLITDSETVRSYLTTEYDYVDFHVVDKFRGIQQGVPHLYSKRMLHAMVEARRDIAHEQEFIKRPEGYTKGVALYRSGFKPHIEKRAVAHHDYAQYRRDVFYKYLYRGWRTQREDAQTWFARWEAEQDLDFQVAKTAMEWSWQHPLSDFPQGMTKDGARTLFENLDLAEKPSRIEHSELPTAMQRTLEQSTKIHR
ncbi:MAG: hypothetical protein V2J55_22450 [Candidatus Competibacteraceae bacterium]|jgi:hypothetical protein|nr:hypothetical protein [Candidatus Competibacteraceae bacterium]